MKIEEFLISDYGPLPERGRFSLGDFNLIYGENESGKTLTIDAIIKMLVGKKASNFKFINRVDELPEGYVLILEDDGKKTKIKGKKTIKNVLDLTFSEFCNLFIIRNSDLEIFKAPDFYNNVTERLLGLRIKDIEEIRKNLRSIGNLTPGGKFSNKGEEKLENRMKNARNSITAIKLLRKKIEEENFDRLEESLINLKAERNNIAKNLTNYENARKREIFEKGKAALDILMEKKKEIEDLSIFNEIDKEAWKTNEDNLSIYNPQKKNLMSELEKNTDLLDNIEQEIIKKQIEIKIPAEVKTKIETDIKREILEFEAKTGELAVKREKSKFFNLIFIISSFLLGLSLFGGLISSYLLGYLLAGIFGTISVVFIFFKFQYIKEKGWVDGFIERLNLELLEIGLKGDNFEEITSNIRLFEADYKKKESELTNSLNLKNNLESVIKNLNNTSIPNLVLEIKKNEDNIVSLKSKSRVESIDAFKVKLGFKQECRQFFENQKAILKNLFGFDVLDDETPISSWSKEIKKLEDYKDKNVELKFNEETVNSLRTKKDELENQLKSITLTMSEINNELSEIEINVNNILKPKEDHYHCETSNDLIKFKEKLDDFLNENNEKRDSILKIIEIFNNIELGEKEKISKLLSKKSSISEYFNEITNGLYNEIRFDMDSATIEVQRKDGQFIKLEYLSGGAYDQLYFSIRLALAEKILKGKTGFFILDDPFIKSDHKRLVKQIDLLKKISSLGWQIIYFSSQNDIKNLLTNDIEKGNMNYIKLESLLS